MKFFDNNNLMLENSSKGKYQKNAITICLVFILVFIIGNILSSIPTTIYMIQDFSRLGILTDPIAIIDYSNNLPANTMIVTLFSTIFTAISAIIYCVCIEKRSLSSMGIIKKKSISKYLKGLLLGFIIFSSAVLIAFLCGSVRFKFNDSASLFTIFLFFLGYLIQGFNEEVLFRGYLLISLSNRTSIRNAIIINSIIFSIFHALNPGVTILAIINIALYGVFASIYTLKYQNIWQVSAFHSMWNFLQGNFYGFSVSGISGDTSLLNITTSKFSIINGGSFGMEGGLAVTVVLIIGILFLTKPRKL